MQPSNHLLNRLLVNVASTVFARVVMPRVLQSEDARTQQANTLNTLLRQAQNTHIGKEYQFATISGYSDYRQRVPLHSYDNLWEKYWKDNFPHINGMTWQGAMKYFALSSGTSSGNTKYLPLSRQMNAANRRAALNVLAWHHHHHPELRPFDGALLYMGGNTRLQTLAKGIHAGDLSAIAGRLRPGWVNRWFAPPFAISDEPEWHTRYQMLLAYLATPRQITSISGVPMWIHKLLCDVRQQKLPGLDQLRLVIHGGAPITSYLDDLHQLLPAGCARREVYAASEGFIGYDDTQGKDWYQQREIRLNTNDGLFFEFVKENDLQLEQPQRYSLSETEIGTTYALVLTTNAGLWSYLIGDLIQVTSHNPARVLFVGRTGWYVNHYGEHLAYSDIEQALTTALEGAATPVHEWSFGLYNHAKESGRHLLILETEHTLPNAFAAKFDAALQTHNSDYASGRATPFLPQSPLIWRVHKGAFDQLLTKMGKGGGQSKVPRMVHDLNRFKEIYGQLQQHLSQKIE